MNQALMFTGARATGHRDGIMLRPTLLINGTSSS
jgi:hypothetical protein